jgi:hypothetical protein
VILGCRERNEKRSAVRRPDETIERLERVGMVRHRSNFLHARVDIDNPEKESVVIGDKLMEDITQKKKGKVVISEERI